MDVNVSIAQRGQAIGAIFRAYRSLPTRTAVRCINSTMVATIFVAAQAGQGEVAAEALAERRQSLSKAKDMRCIAAAQLAKTAMGENIACDPDVAPGGLNVRGSGRADQTAVHAGGIARERRRASVLWFLDAAPPRIEKAKPEPRRFLVQPLERPDA